MLHQTIDLNPQKTATVTTYVLDSEISYNVKKKRPAMIICPGGGYLMTATKEGEAVAVEFLGKGYHTFVLRYSTYFQDRMTDIDIVPKINKSARYPQQVLELMETIHLLHENAEIWQIDTSNIFILGFSAGGHIAATLGNNWKNVTFLKQLSFSPNNDELKPKGIILGYPMIRGDFEAYILDNAPDSQMIKYQTKYTYDCLFGTPHPTKEQIDLTDMTTSINPDTPPTFVWTTRNDQIIDSMVTTKYIERMCDQQLECEYHLFEDGPHGLSLANSLYSKVEEEINLEVSMWIPLVINWLSKQQSKGGK